MKLHWEDAALLELAELSERARGQAEAVVDAMEWMAKVGFSLGRRVGDEQRDRYWSVPPQGVYYHVEGGILIVTAIRDARRRREPW